MVNVIVMQWRNTHHKEMSQSVGIILGVTCRHPSGGSRAGADTKWSQLDQRLPVKLPSLPPFEAPALWQGIVVPVDSVVWNSLIVVLYCVIVVVIVNPAIGVLLEVDVLIPPRGRFILGGHLVPYPFAVPVFEGECPGLVGPHDTRTVWT